MLRYHRILMIVGTVLILSYKTEAFWWGTSERSSTPLPYYYYQQRVLQGPSGSGYPVPTGEPQPIPAVPMHVPLRAQIAPVPHIQNVQLVPCLCPVSQDPEVEKQFEQDNLYLKPVNQVNVNSVKNS